MPVWKYGDGNEVPTRTNGVTTGELSRGLARWKYNTGEDAGFLQLDEKTPEALLQLGIEDMFLLRSIGGRGYVLVLGSGLLVSEIPLCNDIFSNLSAKTDRDSAWRAVLVGRYPPKK